MDVDAPMKHYAGKGKKAPAKPAPKPPKPSKKGS